MFKWSNVQRCKCYSQVQKTIRVLSVNSLIKIFWAACSFVGSWQNLMIRGSFFRSIIQLKVSKKSAYWFTQGPRKSAEKTVDFHHFSKRDGAGCAADGGGRRWWNFFSADFLGPWSNQYAEFLGTFRWMVDLNNESLINKFCQLQTKLRAAQKKFY